MTWSSLLVATQRKCLPQGHLAPQWLRAGQGSTGEGVVMGREGG